MEQITTPIPATLYFYEINGIHIVFGVTEEQELKLFHFSSREFDPENVCRKPFGEWTEKESHWRENFIREAFQLVQVNFSGYNRPYEKHGNKYIVTAPGYLLKYAGIREERTGEGDRLVITQKDEITGARVESTWQFYDGLPIVRMYHTVFNDGPADQTLEYISTFSYTGIEKEHRPNDPAFVSSDEKMTMIIPHNGWQKELDLKKYRFADLGLDQSQTKCYQRTSKTIEVTNTGNWSAKEYLPLGYIGNSAADTGLFFQIEHSGSWHYEIGDQNGHFYLAVSGPTEIQSHWFRNLKSGESFTTVPAAVGVCHDDFEEAAGILTNYRRRIRRPNPDNEKLPVIFNDYMNCLFADPTTEKELPLIDAAAKAGCEYYVIDAGWYADGNWWDNVGEWRESRKRFPNGVSEVTDYIRSKGMVPGVWLELEVMGINCKMAGILPDECFFCRHGKRVYDRSRYQLDFRHPLVIEHVTEVIDRVVREYGVGYIKMDYNIEPGIGTEVDADSAGDGLLLHERAYLEWLDGIYRKYPDLVIENCSSGGLRMDYAMLARNSIQSTSDQEDYRYYATIAANAAAGVTPEQAAIWSYPLFDGTKEEVIFNMVNAMLLRIHQSGHLAEISEERFELVKEGIACYKKIRQDLKTGVPFWPLGFANNEDTHLAAGIRVPSGKIYLAVWRRGGEDTFRVPLERAYPGKQLQVNCIYPVESKDVFRYEEKSSELILHFPETYMARLFEITPV
ncbi:MAG: glycoside hydrolase family 36 protein [Fusicatenibacter sp.]|nr:alpha-galactosidase [Lachnospiraceae bacterium]MDY2937779.1 glycoside hydrolase family 36 protein [Fusicatenibacter sp.]